MMVSPNSSKWDMGRLFRTLVFFRTIPFLGSFDAISIPGPQKQPEKTAKRNKGTVLVVGATGGVGKRVVKLLQERGYEVRGLVRDLDKTRPILGPDVQLIDGDITIPQTLTPAVTNDLKAVICCIGSRVQPQEGDTKEREKYYQGIKFYLPEVVDTPEMVEYIGVKNLVTAVTTAATEKTLCDFTKPTPQMLENWGALDDVVMGGVSESNLRLVNGTAFFSGNISTANSGGFASVRSRNFAPPFNLADYSGIDLRIKGDGNRYKFFIRTDPKWDGIGYSYSFDTAYNIPFTVRIPFSEFTPVFRAKTVPNAPPLDPSQIYSFQIMLSKFEYDGNLNPNFKPGIFQLQIESIKAYGGKKLPQFIQVSSAAVTRPGRPGNNPQDQIPIVKLNDQLGGILTWKLRGENAIRASGLPYTIIRPCALTEEPGGKALFFDQGDNITGKVSREDIAQLCIAALESDAAINRTFEVKETEYFGPNNWENMFTQLNPDN